MSDSVTGARDSSSSHGDVPKEERTEARTSETLTARVQALEQQLRATEERYRQIFNNAHDIVYILDMTGAFVTVNETALRLTGFTLEEIRGQPYSIVVAPEHLELTRENVRRKIAGGGPTTYEIELVAKDGHRIPIEVSSQLLMADGRPVGIQGIARDITERKRHELALRHSEAQAQRHEAQIRQQLERLTALYGVAEQLSLTLDLQHLARDIVRACVESFGVTVAWLGRAESPTAIRRLAHYPSETDFPGHIAGHSDESGWPHNVAMKALRTGIPAVLMDITEQPAPARWRAALQDVAIKSIGAFPLISRDRPVGVLSLYTARPAFFSPERIEFFQAYTHQVAAALENARLYDEAERRLRQLQALRDIDAAISGSLDVRVTFNVFLGHVISLLRADAAAVLLFNPHLQALEYCAGRGFRTAAVQQGHLRLGEGHAGRAALERRMVTVTNLDSDPGDASRSRLLADEKFSGYVAVPLMAKGHVKGVLEIFQRTPLGEGQDWQELLTALAGQAAIAADNAALFDDLQRSNIDLALAYDTTLAGWSRALDLRDRKTEGHTRRVAELTLRLARALGVPDPELVHIRRGALLHDIGKMAIPDSVLLKPGPLTAQEWEIMRQHPLTAYELLSSVAFLRPALDIPYCHHERWDGTGYPRGLQGEHIPLAARIFAVADAFDALQSDRPYRPGMSDDEARRRIVEEAGKQFDPRVVEAFMRLG
ncbi:MAG TPA: HD domain-containing phosphohydrolase [bacterium]|nr:HD domain-containing phosphohydrolase [bacterium]